MTELQSRRFRVRATAAKVANVVANPVDTKAMIRLLRVAPMMSSLENALMYHSVLNPVQTVAERVALKENTTSTNNGR